MLRIEVKNMESLYCTFKKLSLENVNIGMYYSSDKDCRVHLRAARAPRPSPCLEFAG